MKLTLKSEFYVRSRNVYRIPEKWSEYSIYEIEKIKIKEIQEFIQNHKKAKTILINFESNEEVKNFKKKQMEMYISYLPLEAQKVVKNWKVKNKSPYSFSFYNTKKVDWGFKKEGSLRVSNHWGFRSQGKLHCQIEGIDEPLNKWLLCKFVKGKYQIIKEL